MLSPASKALGTLNCTYQIPSLLFQSTRCFSTHRVPLIHPCSPNRTFHYQCSIYHDQIRCSQKGCQEWNRLVVWLNQVQSHFISKRYRYRYAHIRQFKERKVERKLLFCRCRNKFRVDRGGSASDQRPIAGPPPGYITKAILWFCLRYRNPSRIGTTAEAYRCFRRGSRIPEVHHSFDQ